MKVMLKRPGERWQMADVANELAALQAVVGGYIETVTVAKNLAVVCNEEGRLKGLPYNTTLFGVPFVGPILIVSVDGEEFTDTDVLQALRLMRFTEGVTK